MLSGVQTRNGTPHDKYNIRGIAHVCTNRKDDIFMQRRLVQNCTFILEWGQGTSSLTKHTRCWTYSALQYFLGVVMVISVGLAVSLSQSVHRSISSKNSVGGSSNCPVKAYIVL